MLASDVARVTGGKLVGNPLKELLGVSSVDKPRERTVIFCHSSKEAEKVKGLKEVLLVLSEEPPYATDYVLVEDTKLALARFLQHFYPEKHPVGVSPQAVVEEGVSLGEDVYVGPFVYIGRGSVLERGVKVYPFSYIGEGCYIGEESVIFSGVHIYPKTVIGKRVRIHSGAVIGADGFGYHIGKEGITKLHHIGSVVIEDDVEIGANTTVDRALLDETRIGRSTKIDNLVMIGHNCSIGEENVIVAQVGISGSVVTGKRVILAGQVGVADHVRIGNNVTVTAQSGVSSSLEDGKVYGAALPAIEWSKWKRLYAYITKLPELFRERKR
ncbi:UDP-3-O-(3-hydroxymyristoyl) glucosamine N- acyltransferase [Thermocrinis albus DSM 14484]|uniref:UDP-3-O-acylglucosamine N-acyltransferase n=1 Tax=Thermocrinis albus (strain DSM 14484 / JCM 11386 / HI 11/12) TaxID=638303 RepID=D3SPX4_THEAH|nr:UDP-3-O-(3-hydroxymyristoyl)glucosamine N-acyltransferase [Thermocrinis albus]ADC89211.1 UDP-3-O-(3-hydroxymyristoyl) glucosamine N- acyltransferase [Thermocrinis albus DSM 14484]